MKLLTKELEDRFAKVGSQDGKGENAIVIAHYFIGGCDWFVTEFLPDEEVFFGWACLNDIEMAELGYMSLQEFTSVNIRGLGVERDLYWGEKPLKEAIQNLKEQRGWL